MTYLILFFIFLFGLIIGSFLNCLIWRLYEGESMGGRSYCPKCRAQIRWYDNIPLLSFIILRGRCRRCGKPISWQYPAVELIAGLLFILAFYNNFQFSILNFQTISNFQFSASNVKSLFPNPYSLIPILRDWFLIAAMIIIFVYDLRWWLILDVITLPAAAIVLVLNALIGALPFGAMALGQWFGWPDFNFLCFHCSQNLWSYLISGIIGGSFFLFQFVISRGRWIGGGDIRLGLLMGLALGWPGVMVAIFLAYFMGSIVGLSLIATGKKQWGSKVPFGVFLSTATIIVLFFGEEIVRWYLGLF